MNEADDIRKHLEEYRDSVTKQQVSKIMKDHFQERKRNIFNSISATEEGLQNIRDWQIDLRRRNEEGSANFRNFLNSVCVSDLDKKIKTAKVKLNELMREEQEIFSWISKTKWADRCPEIEDVSDEVYWDNVDKFINERKNRNEKRIAN